MANIAKFFKKHRTFILLFFVVIINLALGLGLGLGLPAQSGQSVQHFENSAYSPSPSPFSQIHRAFIISLTDSLYKKTKHDLLLSGLQNIQYFDAIRGSTLPNSPLVKDRSILTIKALYDMLIADHRQAHSDLGTFNTMGCYLSHTTLWKQLLDDPNADGYYIFETDAVCYSNLIRPVEEFLSKPDPHILFFGIHGFSGRSSIGLTRFVSKFYGLYSYFITKEGARRCLESAFPIEEQLDSYLSDLLLLSNDKKSGISPLNFYIVDLCAHLGTGTTLHMKPVKCT